VEQECTQVASQEQQQCFNVIEEECETIFEQAN